MLLAYISCLSILRFDIIALLFMGPTYHAKNRGPEESDCNKSKKVESLQKLKEKKNQQKTVAATAKTRKSAAVAPPPQPVFVKAANSFPSEVAAPPQHTRVSCPTKKKRLVAARKNDQIRLLMQKIEAKNKLISKSNKKS
jgi:hypothetical protein